MPPKLSFSTWNIHAISNNVLGDKTKNKDFINNINSIDFLVVTETWCNTNVNVPGFGAFVSDALTSHTSWVCCKSSGITLLTKVKYEKFVTVM